MRPSSLAASIAVLVVMGPFASLAWGYQVIHVTAETAELREKPTLGSPVVETLGRGAALSAEDQPRKGFYWARSRSGKLGWIAAEEVSAKVPAQARSVQPQQTKASAQSSKNRIEVLGGWGAFALSDLSEQVDVTGFQSGLWFGAVLSHSLSPSFSLGLRLDYLSKTVSVEELATGSRFDISLKSIPVMAGFEWSLLESPSWLFRWNVFGGLGMSSSFQIQSSANSTTLSGTALTGLTTGSLTWKLSPSFGLVVEGGYRYLKTAQLTPVTTGVGTALSNPAAIDLSGLLFGAGLEARF